MTHATPPLSGENLLMDDEDVILLTDEIPSAENPDLIEICQIADRSEPQEDTELSVKAKEKPAYLDLTDAIEVSDFKTEFPPDFSVSEADILNLDLQDPQAPDSCGQEPKTAPLASNETLLPVAEYQPDDLQRLIDEVVHDSQVPPQDFSGVASKISMPMDMPDDNGGLTLSQDQIDAAMERVIRKLFAEKIESVLDEVITATVNREIQNLKTILLDYLASGRPIHKIQS